ncbi:hypothetical protein FRA_24c00420 [Francisella sp. W12-1067]|nr:hypothetical protein FRA_24c00420 [Francisella sp. W12-1067]
MSYITDWWENKLPTLGQIKLRACSFDVQCILLQPQDGYKIILGRFKYNNFERLRIWYRSKSESCWRAFTGFREDGSWQKGDEGGPDYRGSGYVFECMVAPELDKEFDDFFTKKLVKNINNLFLDIYTVKYSNFRLFDYLVATHNNNQRPGIAQEYAAERKFSRPLKDANVLPIPKSGHENFSKVGSIAIQKGYKGKLVNMSYLQNYHNLFGDALRAGHIGKRRSRHDVLNQDIDIDTYQFEYNGEMYCYEIAKTLNEVPHYSTRLNNNQPVNARVVWVRMLYQLDNNEVSSFGNYKVIPIEMAGLVQKPCDYSTQVANVYKNEIQQQGTLGGAYVLLSVMNEITSPIIQQYKLINNEPLLSGNSEPMLDGVKFTYTTPPSFKLLQLNRPFLLSGANMFKPPVIQQPVIQQPVIQQPVIQQPVIQPQQIINVDYNVISDKLIDCIIEGIMRYNALWEMRNINKDAVEYREDAEKFKLGHHGDTGLRRAAELMRCVTREARDLEEVDSYLVSCFKDNNIGNEKHTFRAIKSEPYSLFTLINLSLLHVLKSFKFDWQYDGNLKYIPLIHALYSCFSKDDIQAGPDKFVNCVEPVSSKYLDFVKKIDTKSKSPVQELIIKRKQIVII